MTAAFTALASSRPKDPETDHYEPFEARAADAVELAATRAGELADPDRPFVVVRTDPGALSATRRAKPSSPRDDGSPRETARRLACDCRWQLVVENDEGDVVRLGRTTRQIPGWLLRQLRRRDRGCRFQGCGATRWLHAHHLTHWADGGATDHDNLVMLCGRHHRVVHEGGWQVASTREGTVTFHKPDGQVLTCGPPTPTRRPTTPLRARPTRELRPPHSPNRLIRSSSAPTPGRRKRRVTGAPPDPSTGASTVTGRDRSRDRTGRLLYMDRIGVVDTMFARYDMGAEAVDELKQCPGFGERFEVVRRTVPGFKDLGRRVQAAHRAGGLRHRGRPRACPARPPSTRSAPTRRHRASCWPSC